MLLSHKPLQDKLIELESYNIIKNITNNDTDLDTWKPNLYTNTFRQWLLSSSSHKVFGLEQFGYEAYSAGSTDGIQSFILRHIRHRRIRCSRAEFVLTKIVTVASGGELIYLEDEEIKPGDAVILSFPFAGNGSEYFGQNELLQDCLKHSVPVCLDVAYFSISSGINFDFSFPCITDIVTSLSKSFVTQLRLGVRFTRKYVDDQIQANNDISYYNRITAFIGIKLMEKFNHDYIVSKYQKLQNIICRENDIDPTPTLTLALGDSKKYPEFVRENICRICITDELRRLA